MDSGPQAPTDTSGTPHIISKSEVCMLSFAHTKGGNDNACLAGELMTKCQHSNWLTVSTD
jgi:hypothetical protein